MRERCVLCSKLSERQRELMLEYARTETLENGTVDGLEQGSLYVFINSVCVSGFSHPTNHS